MPTHQTALLWFRRDLRLTDNPALTQALAEAHTVIPVYLHAPEEEAPWAPGAASRWWLHFSLKALERDLKRIGSRLVARRGPSLDALKTLLRETGATLVAWNRLYEPPLRERDQAVEEALQEESVEVTTHNAALFVEPWEIQTQQHTPFRVFTPFWRACRTRLGAEVPKAAPAHMPKVATKISSLDIDDLDLLPAVDWAHGIRNAWTPGEKGALENLASFSERVADYATGRDRPAAPSTSRLSPHLHFGELSPRQILATLHETAGGRAEAFVRELGWREFAHHLLYHFPHTADEPLDERFRFYPWQHATKDLHAWQRGRTGIPLVDAGMRELWHTGWMHNRVRMVVASFLTKNLRIAWQEGTRWFWDTLVDADLANNTLGWQWTAGCGADAAPYFRVFNPVLQAEKFDPQGAYVRHWVPELAQLPDKWLNEPWHAPAAVLDEAGVELGRTYPRPIVDLKSSRENALEGYKSLQSTVRGRH